jgi:hypothetical protein
MSQHELMAMAIAAYACGAACLICCAGFAWSFHKEAMDAGLRGPMGLLFFALAVFCAAAMIAFGVIVEVEQRHLAGMTRVELKLTTR